jgi:hypothetical protein
MVESFFQIPPNSTGSKIATNQQVIGANTVEIQYVKSHEPATFFAITDRIAPAANKYILTLFNTSATRKVVLQRAYVFNWNLTAVTGVALEHEFKRITARTAGTTVTINPMDTADTISAGITCDHTSTGVTDSTLYKRGFTTAEEVKITPLAMDNMMAINDDIARIYEKKDGCKGITCRQNQGVTIKNITSSTIGTVSAMYIFTDEPV